MSIRPDTRPPVQDMPPPGGFPKVDTVRSLPARGPKGWQIWAGVSVAIMYGFYQIGKTNKERSQQKLEERRIRYAIAPIMQAEADREYAEREKAILQREAEIMKNVPDWTVGKSPYFSGRWMPRAVNQLDKSAR